MSCATILLVACDGSDGYTYTPAYEPPTPDPSQAASVAESYVSLQMTQQAAEAQRAIDSAYADATSTAVAGDIAILKFAATQTAGAATAEYQGTQWAATMTQDATNAAGALQAANAESTRVQSEIESQATQAWATAEAARLQVERQEMTNTFNAWAARLIIATAAIAIIVVAAVLIWLIGLALVKKKNNQAEIQATGPNGVNAVATVNTETGLVTYNPAAMPAVHVNRKTGAITPLSPFSAEDQLASLLANLYVLYEQARHSPYPPVKPTEPLEHENKWQVGPFAHTTHTKPVLQPPAARPTPERPALASGAPGAQLLHAPESALPADAPWRLLNDWRGGSLPIGAGTGGLLLADPERDPHLLISGTTRSGKTFMLRTVIACALADGWQVVIISKRKPGLQIFASHPNATLVWIERDAAEDAIGYMRAVFGEIERRNEVLLEHNADTWKAIPDAGPRTLVAFDEFSNLAEDQNSGREREELWKWSRMSTREGGKCGVHIALALQDPTHESIDLRIRRNCLPVSFRVRDSAVSRTILNESGAEKLQNRQFIANIGGLVYGLSITANDDDIAAFLAGRPVAVHPAPAWLETSPIEELPAAISDDQTDRIRALRAQGKSLNAIQDEVFNYRGGAAYKAVKHILSEAEGLA